MDSKQIPDWFFDLFHDMVIKHGLSQDMWEYHLEGAKEIYLKMSAEIDNGGQELGKWDKESVTLESLKNWSIGRSNIEEDDEFMRMYNGNQFLFLSEFYKELYKSLSTSENNTEEQLPASQYKSESQKIA